MTEAELKKFHDSFDRCMTQDSRFFDVFYDKFLGSSEEVRAKFAHTDFVRQKRALRVSLLLIMEAAVQKDRNLSVLKRTAVRHSRGHLDIHPRLYGLWLDALIETVRECDREFDEETGSVWRSAFQGAIDYLVSKY